jgi:CRISPR-associated protein Csb2
MAKCGSPSPTLAGKDASGVPLRGHAHAHYLALDVDDDRLIDHLVVWAPAGIGEEELRALTSLRRLSTRQTVDGLHPLRLAVEAAGDPAAVVPELVGPARNWTSLTPFAPPRHQTRRQTFEEFIRDAVGRELANRGLQPADVDPIPADWPAFRRRRLVERIGADRHAIGVRLHFTDAITGPICLGALSHFGLGAFVPT